MDIAEFHVSFFLCQCSFQISFRMKNVFYAIQFQFEINFFTINFAKSAEEMGSMLIVEMKLPSLHKRTVVSAYFLQKYFLSFKEMSKYLDTIQKVRKLCKKNVPKKVYKFLGSPKKALIEAKCRNAINHVVVKMGGNLSA